jgi:hypothetical protein
MQQHHREPLQTGLVRANEVIADVVTATGDPAPANCGNMALALVTSCQDTMPMQCDMSNVDHN